MAHEGMNKVFGNFEAALDRFGDRVKEVSRVGAQAMAQVVYESARENAPVSKYSHVFYGTHARYNFKAGTLRDSIYQVFSEDNSVNGRAEYHVAWNHSKCPYGFMVEFGTSHSAAYPFLWPAFEQNKVNLLAVANNAMAEEFKA